MWNELIGAVGLGLIWTLMTFGLYISFRILDVADMTVEGSLTMGAAITAVCISAGIPPLVALLIAILGGMLAGMVTGLGLQRKLLTGTIAGSALTLVLTALLCPLPSWRLYGAGAAMLAGHGLRLAWCMLVLHRNISAKKNNFVPKRG